MGNLMESAPHSLAAGQALGMEGALLLVIDCYNVSLTIGLATIRFLKHSDGRLPLDSRESMAGH
jgi:hypothetical protein